MGFSLPTFLRRAAPESLRAYFSARRHATFDNVDWSMKPAVLHAELVKRTDGLPEADRERAILDFERVEQLRDETGQIAIQSVIGPDSAPLLAAIQALPGAEARGLLLLTTDAALFDRALATAYAGRLWHGQSWSRYPVGKGEVAASEGDVEALRVALSALFQKHDGSGRRLKMDIFERRALRDDKRTAPPTVQYSAYVQALPETSLEFDGEEPTPRIRRPAVEAAICHDRELGQIEVVAKGGRPMRDGIAAAFVRSVLHGKDVPEPIKQQPVNLTPLLTAGELAYDQADGIKDVRVTRLRLARFGTASGRLTIEIDGEGPLDLARTSAAWFGAANPLTSGDWVPSAATLRFVFHPEKEGAKEKTISVQMTYPNGSNLKDHLLRHQFAVNKCLSRLGIVATR